MNSQRVFGIFWRAIGMTIALLVSTRAWSQDELPKRDNADRLDFEPNMKLYDVKPEPGSGTTVPWESIPADEAKAQADAELARKKAERWQGLQKRGIVSKVEAERALTQANRASLRFQRAHVAALRVQLESLKKRATKGETSSDMVASAASALATAERLAADAEALARKTELEFARTNVERQQQLLRLGLGSKSQLSRAEAELARLETAVSSPAQ